MQHGEKFSIIKATFELSGPGTSMASPSDRNGMAGSSPLNARATRVGFVATACRDGRTGAPLSNSDRDKKDEWIGL